MARLGGCTQCGCNHTTVRKTEEKTYKWRGKLITRIRRTRRCRHCGWQWFSTEVTEEEYLEAAEDLEVYDSIPTDEG